MSQSNEIQHLGEITVNPRIANDCRSLWQAQLGYLSLYIFIL